MELKKSDSALSCSNVNGDWEQKFLSSWHNSGVQLLGDSERLEIS